MAVQLEKEKEEKKGEKPNRENKTESKISGTLICRAVSNVLRTASSNVIWKS